MSPTFFIVETTHTTRSFSQARSAWAAFNLMKQQRHAVTLLADDEDGRRTLARWRPDAIIRHLAEVELI